MQRCVERVAGGTPWRVSARWASISVGERSGECVVEANGGNTC